MRLIAIIILWLGTFALSHTLFAQSSPNIIVILADDMGYSDISPYGGEIQTPALQTLADEGLRFRHFYNSARCSPTRASLLTGLDPHEAGMGRLATAGATRGHLGYLNNNCVTIAEVLRDAGYATYMSGKWHLGEQQNQGRWPTDRGFDRYWGLISGASSYYELVSGNRQMALDNTQWDPDVDYSPAEFGRTDFFMTDATSDYAVKFLDEHFQNNAGNPFFLYVSYTAPHWPLHAHESDVDKYDGVYDAGWDQIRDDRLAAMQAIGLVDQNTGLTPRDWSAWNSIPADDGDQDADDDQGDYARRMQVYAAQVDRMDQGIAQIRQALQSNGALDNTIIIFLSDNGGSDENVAGRNLHDYNKVIGEEDTYLSYLRGWSNASNTPFRKHKSWLYEGGIITPLIVHWPDGIAAANEGQIVDQAGHIHDIMPTVLDAAAVSYPATFNGNSILPARGTSLLPALQNPGQSESRELFFEQYGRRAGRSGKWKIVSAGGGWELYDMEADPTETDNIASTYPVAVANLSARYEQWAREMDLIDPVTNNGNPPLLAAPFPDAEAAPGELFSYTFPLNTFTDPDAGEVLRYSATLADGNPLPAWLSFDEVAQTFSGTPPSIDDPGIEIEVTATDTEGNTATGQFLITEATPFDGCVDISPLACQEVTVDICSPVTLEFDGTAAAGVEDADGNVTGFTMIDPPSAPLTTPSNPGLPGYEPADLQMAGGLLAISTRAGIAFRDPGQSNNTNSQVNTLGVGFDASQQDFVLETTLINPPAGTQSSEQAGLWFGLDEDTFVKFVLVSSGNGEIISLRVEENAVSENQDVTGALDVTDKELLLKLLIDVDDQTATGYYAVDGGQEVLVGTESLSAAFFQGETINPGLTASFGGIFATHRNGPASLTYTFENFKAYCQGSQNNTPPVLNTPVPAPPAYEEGAAFSFSLAEDTFTDAEDGTGLLYSAALQGNDPLPGWLAFDPANRIFSAVAGSSLAGVYSVEVTATDQGGLSASTVFQLVINAPDILYRDVFGNDNPNVFNGNPEPLASFDGSGWVQYYAPTGSPMVQYLRTDPAPKGAVSGFDGNPANLENVNAGPTRSSVDGFLFASLGGGDQPWLAYTEEYAIDLSQTQVYTFSWRQGHNQSGAASRVAVRIDGQWYVSSTAFTNTAVNSASNFSTDAEPMILTFDPQAAGWSTLDFQEGNVLGIGGTLSTDLPDGMISAFGLYTEYSGGGNVTLRFDTYQISGETTAQPAPDIAVTPGNIDFGQVETGNSAPSQPVTMTNNGDAALEIASINLTGAEAGLFSLPDLPDLPLTIPAGASAADAFSVSFSPLQTGGISAVIEIAGNDPDLPLLTLPLSGEGVEPFCAPISTLDCAGLPVSLPFSLQFDQDAGGIADQNGVGTGFTAVMEHSEARRPGDLAISNPEINGYEPSLLNVNAGTGVLEVLTQGGIAFLDPPESSNNNNQVNTLGVGLQNLTQPFRIRTTLLDVNTGEGFAQAGLWFGFDEDNYIKFNVQDNDLALRTESGGLSPDTEVIRGLDLPGLPGADLTLELEIDPATLTVQAYYTLGSSGVRTLMEEEGKNSLTLPADFFSGRTLPEVSGGVTFAGIFATHRNGAPFTAVFDEFAVAEIDNQPPLADAGPDQTLEDSDLDGMEEVTLNGAGSTDSDGQIVSYVWTENGDQVATGPSPVVSLSTGVHPLLLTVTDDDGDTGSDEVIVTVEEGTPPISVPFRMNVGGEDYDRDGVLFLADDVAYFVETQPTTLADGDYALNSPDEALYYPRRYGPEFSYIFPVANGDYTLVLHMVENFFTAADDRVFDVVLEGATEIDDLDLFADYGLGNPYLAAVDVTVSDGVLNLDFFGETNNAIVQAIEILPPQPVLSDENDILSFSLPQATGPAVIDAVNHTVAVEVAVGTDLTGLIPAIAVSPAATIVPASGVAQDFSSPVVYTVTAEDGSGQDWTVTVTTPSAPDSDQDGVPDAVDLCPDVYNPGQLDFNNNGIGDHCEDTPVSYTPAAERPNILWITVEDMSPQIAPFGDPTAPTPNLDQLAAEGIRFFNAFTTSGVCSPSRAAIITGMHQNSIGAQHMRATQNSTGQPNAEVQVGAYEAVPPPEVKTFTEYLRAAGYFATNDNKTDFQFDVPITTFDENGSGADWRDRPDPNQPFFSIINIFNTHESQVFNNPGQFGNIDPGQAPVPPYYPDNQVVREDIAVNYNNIASMDQQVGNILNRLETDGLLDNTIVFFFSDHGAGLPRAKRWIYDSGIRIPLIIRFPDGSYAGDVTQELVSTVDLAPTLLSLVGINIPEHLQGQALLGAAAEPQDRDYIYAAKDRMIESYDYIRAVRDRQFKLIRNYDPGRPYIQPLAYRDQMNIMQELHQMKAAGTANSIQALWLADTRPVYELYDISKDPHEVNNLADDPAFANKLNELQAALDAWMIETQGSAEPDVSDLPAAEQALVETGWPGGQQPTTATPEFALSGNEVTITCATPGASIAYKVNDESYWQVYTGSLLLSEGDNLKARAIRIGYQESAEAGLDVPVAGPRLEGKLPNQLLIAGETATFSIGEEAFTHDDPNENLTYSADLPDDSSLPAWITFDAATRTFTATPPAEQNLEIRVTAADSEGETASAVFLLVAFSAETPQVVYREVFGNSSTEVNKPLSEVGWQTFAGGGIEVTDNEDPPNGVASRFPGAPDNLSNVNAGPGESDANGFWYAGLAGQAFGFGFTEEFCFPLSGEFNYTISWFQGHNSDQMMTRVALRIAGQWYVSEAGFTNTAVGSAGDFTAGAELKTFEINPAAAGWRSLDLVPGSSLSLAPAPLTTDLPEGVADAFGLFVEVNGGDTNFRADAYQIEVVPAGPATQPVPVPTPALAAICQEVTTQEEEAVNITLQSGTDFTAQQLANGGAHYTQAIAEYTNTNQYPRSADDGNLNTTGPGSWTSGFFPGLLWYFYEYTGDEAYKNAALTWTAGLESQKNNTGTHDVGFIIGSSFGNGLRLLEGQPEVADYENIIIQAAESLITRYDEDVQAIRSWDFGSWNYPVIIDNMMNLELLFRASELSGDPKYQDIAINHAMTTLRDHYRPDGSSYHVVDYDDATGAVIDKTTHQGAGDESSWARGQAWGMYGFTMAFRETGITAFLDQALAAADYIIGETLPDNPVPFWDYSASGNAPRDASAAAITASALLELMHYDETKRTAYFEAALQILKELSKPEYSAMAGTNNNFILKRSTGNNNADSEVDVPLIYADYYYVEALIRLEQLQPAGTLSYTVDMPANGALSGTAPDLVYSPAPGFSGSDQFAFTVSAGGEPSNSARVSIEVLPVIETLPVWYRETFGNSSGANQSAAPKGWQLFGGTDGKAITDFDGTVTPRGGVSFFTGNPTDLNDVRDGFEVPVADQQQGYTYIFNDGPVDYFAFTELLLDRSQYEPTSISWYQGHNQSTMESRPALRINGQWYVSNTTFTNTALQSGSGFTGDAEYQELSFDPAAANWSTLDFEEGTVLAIGVPLSSDLPSGDITAFGLLTTSAENAATTLRFDTYEIQVETAPPVSLSGNMTLQGRNDYSGDLTLQLFEAGTGILVESRIVQANASGQFQLTGLPTGAFDLYLKYDRFLQVAVNDFELSPGLNSIDFGELRAGDADDNNQVEAIDFSILAGTFNLAEGEPGYDGRADFNGDAFITALDFSLLASNFNTSGQEPLVSGMEVSTRSEEPVLNQVDLRIRSAEDAVKPGAVFVAELLLKAGAQRVDAVEAHLRFDPGRLEVTDIEWTGALSLVLRESFDNGSGTIDLATGSLRDYTSGEQVIARIRFRAKAKGAAEIVFDKQGLPSDATFLGNSILKSLRGASLQIGQAGIAKSMRVLVFPIPARDRLQVFVTDPADPGEVEVRVYNLDGKLLIDKPLNGPELMVGQLPSGVYLLEVVSGGAIHRSRFIRK